jgi:hypothetical protein
MRSTVALGWFNGRQRGATRHRGQAFLRPHDYFVDADDEILDAEARRLILEQEGIDTLYAVAEIFRQERVA